MRIDAKRMGYRELNREIRSSVENGSRRIVIDNVVGQRYIGCGLKAKVRITINGVPGNDLAAFMDGPSVAVNGNAQDGVGNTMNAGKVVIHGSAGDITGYAMRGGRIYVRGDVGYRVGIHMKSFKNSYPVIIAGGTAGDFLGEYMAGGLLVILGLERGNPDSPIVGDYVGTGMHGGTIYIRGEIKERQLGREVGVVEPEPKELRVLRRYLREYCSDFSMDFDKVISDKFVRLVPVTHRPYGNLYAY